MFKCEEIAKLVEKLKRLSEKMAASAARLEPWRQLTRQLFRGSCDNIAGLGSETAAALQRGGGGGGKGGELQEIPKRCRFHQGVK